MGLVDGIAPIKQRLAHFVFLEWGDGRDAINLQSVRTLDLLDSMGNQWFAGL